MKKCAETEHRFKTIVKGLKWVCRKCGVVRTKEQA